MVTYFHNKHANPLLELLAIARDVVVTPEHHEAITELELAIEQQKEHAPYRLWLRANPPTTQEKAL
ncbi:MAG TPA: hypothetical protein VJ396_07035 [Acidiferrobacterales bacterium]|nr:hypothetical protein [Acidiferrobacterales bacterium]